MTNIHFKVTEDPEFTPTQLAGHLTEAYLNVDLHLQQADTYATQANAERTKAVRMRDILDQIRKDPSRNSLVTYTADGRPRRMDPYKTYSEQALREQLRKHEHQAVQFDADATNFRAKVAQARSEITRITGELRNV